MSHHPACPARTDISKPCICEVLRKRRDTEDRKELNR